MLSADAPPLHRLIVVSRQAYETRSEFSRQRTSLAGINTRMTRVLSQVFITFLICLVLNIFFRYHAWHRQSSVYDQITQEKRLRYYGCCNWCLYHHHSVILMALMTQT